jgi:hypothetical protein
MQVPYERVVEKIVEVPYERIVHVPVERVVVETVERPIPVERIVERIVQVPVDRIVQVLPPWICLRNKNFPVVRCPWSVHMTGLWSAL